jgi:hypothetical protein
VEVGCSSPFLVDMFASLWLGTLFVNVLEDK